MIYTASYFQKENHHGKLVSVSRTIPKIFSTMETLNFFTPSSFLLKDWKDGVITKEQYIARFRKEIRGNLPKITEWVNKLDPSVDLTLLCWEKAGEFCHRNLIIKFIERDRPDCYGGCDILNKVLSKA
jgi:uncharacterized protein YeaO (DUF488 family)